MLSSPLGVMVCVCSCESVVFFSEVRVYFFERCQLMQVAVYVDTECANQKEPD